VERDIRSHLVACILKECHLYPKAGRISASPSYGRRRLDLVSGVAQMNSELVANPHQQPVIILFGNRTIRQRRRILRAVPYKGNVDVEVTCKVAGQRR